MECRGAFRDLLGIWWLKRWVVLTENVQERERVGEEVLGLADNPTQIMKT